MAITLKNKEQIALMRKANMIVFEVHEELTKMISPGVTTFDLDKKAKELCQSKGAIPAFLGYPASMPNVIPFPGVICASPNDVIVHGIPSKEPLKEGDILSIDFGCCYEGFFGDSARTHAIGEIDETASKLLDTTADSLEKAIEQCVAGNRIGDISFAVQQRVEADGFGIVREFVGHGIGSQMHEPPQVPNFGRAGQGRILKPGLVIAIEPMVTVGAFETRILGDGWTASTRDGSLAAHFEHTVAITDGEPFVLSRP